MNYYRKTVNNVVDNVKLKMQMAAFTLKLSENNGNISSNLTKIGNNETDISSNLTKIGNNETNISSNLTKIGNNETNISSNLKLTGEKSDIIADNKNNITNNYNISQINKKKSEFNTSLCDTNRNNIASNLLLINEINNYNKIRSFIKFETVNNINRAISINSPKFSIIKNDIVFEFKKGSYIECHLSILIRFILHYINIQFFHILLEYFDDQNDLFKSIKMGLVGQISKLCILNNYCVTMIPNDYKKYILN